MKQSEGTTTEVQGLPRYVIALLWCRRRRRSILIENLPEQMSVPSGAFEVPRQQDPTLPLCITEPVCGWFLKGISDTCRDPCVPMCVCVSARSPESYARPLVCCHTAPSWKVSTFYFTIKCRHINMYYRCKLGHMSVYRDKLGIL